MRWLRTVAFGLLVLLLGLSVFPAFGVCDESCNDQDGTCQCLSACLDCACCSFLRAWTPPINLEVARPAIAQFLVGPAIDGPLRPDPDEILHVPKLSRA